MLRLGLVGSGAVRFGSTIEEMGKFWYGWVGSVEVGLGAISYNYLQQNQR